MKHKQELIDILLADSKLQHKYADKDGNTCAIGGIAIKFGWSGKPLRKPLRKAPGIDRWQPSPNKRSISALMAYHTGNKLVQAMKKAQEYFNLEDKQIRDIQITNDAWPTTEQRHDALERLVKGWEES